MSPSLLDFPSILETGCFSGHPGIIRLLFQYQCGQNCHDFPDHRVSLPLKKKNVKSTLKGFVCVETLTLQRGSFVEFIGLCSIWVCMFFFYFALKIFFFFQFVPVKGYNVCK